MVAWIAAPTAKMSPTRKWVADRETFPLISNTGAMIAEGTPLSAQTTTHAYRSAPRRPRKLSHDVIQMNSKDTAQSH